MVAGCTTNLIKLVFFIFNFLFFVFGLAIAGAALWVRFDNAFQSQLDGLIEQAQGEPLELGELYMGLYVIAFAGIILFTTAFLGCCGAFFENVSLLGLFFVIVMLLFGGKIVGSVLVYANKDTVKEDLSTWFEQQLVAKYHDNAEIRHQLDILQTKLECCGSRGCADYGALIPDSCNCNTTDVGCATVVYETIETNLTVVSIVLVGVLAVELAAMLFACILCNGIRDAKDKSY